MSNMQLRNLVLYQSYLQSLTLRLVQGFFISYAFRMVCGYGVQDLQFEYVPACSFTVARGLRTW